MKHDNPKRARARAESLFLEKGGYLRASEAFESGIHPRILYGLRDDGIIEPISRGLFRLKAIPSLTSPELFTIGVKIPSGVLCLESALEFHQLSKQKTEGFSVALCKGSDKPKIKGLSVKYYLISEPAFSEGIQIHQKDKIDLRVYSPEKTIADCFKFRNKIGLPLCLEALQLWWNAPSKNLESIEYFAKICRVDKILDPYLQLLISQQK